MTTTTETVECDCSDEYGPCERHGETLVQRDGASSRTADELVQGTNGTTGSVQRLARSLADVLKRDNTRFDRQRFYDAVTDGTRVERMIA